MIRQKGYKIQKEKRSSGVGRKYMQKLNNNKDMSIIKGMGQNGRYSAKAR